MYPNSGFKPLSCEDWSDLRPRDWCPRGIEGKPYLIIKAVRHYASDECVVVVGNKTREMGQKFCHLVSKFSTSQLIIHVSQKNNARTLAVGWLINKLCLLFDMWAFCIPLLAYHLWREVNIFICLPRIRKNTMLNWTAINRFVVTRNSAFVTSFQQIKTR